MIDKDQKEDKSPMGLFAPPNLGLAPTIPVLLRDKFVVPPFSLLNTMQDYWQQRKGLWLRLGIKGELGRGENLLKFSDSVRMDGKAYQERFQGRATTGRKYGVDFESDGAKRMASYDKKKCESFGTDNLPAFSKNYTKEERMKHANVPGFGACPTGGVGAHPEKFGRKKQSGTSIFDPVLCELAYRWFCPPGGHILDPFAGGSVRGIVATYLNYKYTGVDLSAAQIEANREQGREICPDNQPTWHIGDSLQIKNIAPGEYDGILSCPPYYNLEVYGNDPKDLSNMTVQGFFEAYRKIIKDCVSMLKENRFACWVIGEVRDKETGFYHGLVPETIYAFEDAGAAYYNEIILFTSVGTLPIRVQKHFNSGRKIGKTHQNVLIFYKGDTKKIKEIFGEVV